MDPFCGSGTVLLEAALAGHKAVGVDCNPLARLIARVKTTPLDPASLHSSVRRLVGRIDSAPDCGPPAVVNLEYWYLPRIIRELARIKWAISRTRHAAHREFFEVAFSVAVRRLSLADPRVPVPVRQCKDRYDPDHWLYELAEKRLSWLLRVDVQSEFLSIVRRNCERMLNAWRLYHDQSRVNVLDSDARQILGSSGRRVRADLVDLVVTSPPYLSAQKYVRSSSLSLGWLGLCCPDELIKLERQQIGREHFRTYELEELESTGIREVDDFLSKCFASNRQRAVAIASYFNEMRNAIKRAAEVLRSGGHMILVVGDNRVQRRRFRTASHLRSLSESEGFVTKAILIDTIRSRGLLTKRHRSAGTITAEYVIILERP